MYDYFFQLEKHLSNQKAERLWDYVAYPVKKTVIITVPYVFSPAKTELTGKGQLC